MRVIIRAVGKAAAGEEGLLAERYRLRAEQFGRGLGVSTVTVQELAESKARSAEERKTAEGKQLLADLPARATIVALDERGAQLTSQAFADLFGRWREAGRADIIFIIGGADGLAGEIGERAEKRLAFGAATWPHLLVPVLLLEQIYRAFTILAGHPYHRA